MHSHIKSRNAPPQASAMIEALRGLGYNTATALADIIFQLGWSKESSHYLGQW